MHHLYIMKTLRQFGIILKSHARMSEKFVHVQTSAMFPSHFLIIGREHRRQRRQWPQRSLDTIRFVTFVGRNWQSMVAEILEVCSFHRVYESHILSRGDRSTSYFLPHVRVTELYSDKNGPFHFSHLDKAPSRIGALYRLQLRLLSWPYTPHWLYVRIAICPCVH